MTGRSFSWRLLVFCLVLGLVWVPAAFGQLKVRPDHPRLLIRAESGGDPRIVTPQMIKARAADPRFDRFRQKLNTASFINRRSTSITNLAMRALAYDDDVAADSAIAMLVEPIRFDGTTWDGISVMWAALTFDWLYNHPHFDQQEKDLAVKQIIQGGERLYRILQSDNDVFHTRMYGWPTGLAAAGLALMGHYDNAPRMVNFAYDYYRNDLFHARQLEGGAVHNGFGYGRHYTMWLTGAFLSLIYTATGEDLWTEIRQHQDDWAAREAGFIMYGRQPDGLFAKFADCYRRTSERFSFRVVSERNWYYREPVFQSYLNMLLEEQKEDVFERGNEYIAFLYYDPDLPSADFRSLPKRTVFGPDGPGMVFWKGGWGPDDTWIFFKCGDYFENHGHYDQGHVEIFRGAPLLAEAGAYAGGFDSEFRMDFYRRSIAHNTMLVVDPDKPDDIGDQRVYMNQSLGTMKEYLADLGAETGDIIAYREGENVSYLMADLTAAYPRDRVQRLTRELALVGDRFLVVRDRVTLADPRFLPKVLWHCPVYPRMESGGFTVTRGGSRLVYRVLAPSSPYLKWVEGVQVGNRVLEMPKMDPATTDPGVGRVELVGRTGQAEQTFVQVLDIAPENVAPGGFSLSEDSRGMLITLPGQRKLLIRQADALLE